jgi:hypothetical protein
LNLNHDKLLSSSAFTFNLRRYNMGHRLATDGTCDVNTWVGSGDLHLHCCQSHHRVHVHGR